MGFVQAGGELSHLSSVSSLKMASKPQLHQMPCIRPLATRPKPPRIAMEDSAMNDTAGPVSSGGPVRDVEGRGTLHLGENTGAYAIYDQHAKGRCRRQAGVRNARDTSSFPRKKQRTQETRGQSLFHAEQGIRNEGDETIMHGRISSSLVCRFAHATLPPCFPRSW